MLSHKDRATDTDNVYKVSRSLGVQRQKDPLTETDTLNTILCTPPRVVLINWLNSHRGHAMLTAPQSTYQHHCQYSTFFFSISSCRCYYLMEIINFVTTSFYTRKSHRLTRLSSDTAALCLPYMCFKNSDVPQQRITPPAMIAIRSPRRSASSMKCVDSTMVRPARCRCSKSHVCRRASGSIPDVGSSKITTFIHHSTDTCQKLHVSSADTTNAEAQRI